jgi:hypothetical protein
VSYDGVVVFVEGVHYGVTANGDPDLNKPLRWAEDGYRDAEDGEPLHNDTHGGGDTTLEPGSE